MSWSLKASEASTQEVLGILRLGDQAVEQLGAAVERAAEALLLVADPAHDRLAARHELRMGVGGDLDRALGEAAEVGRLEAEHAALLDRAAHDPAQDVAAVLVRGHDAVGDQAATIPREWSERIRIARVAVGSSAP